MCDSTSCCTLHADCRHCALVRPSYDDIKLPDIKVMLSFNSITKVSAQHYSSRYCILHTSVPGSGVVSHRAALDNDIMIPGDLARGHETLTNTLISGAVAT